MTADGITLIIGDVHLCDVPGADDGYVLAWFQRQVECHRPSHVVFNGDTFELAFRPGHRAGKREPLALLATILDVHAGLVDYVRRCPLIDHITFVAGEHDHFIAHSSFRDVLERAFRRCTVDVTEYYHEPRCDLLAFHGHQLDYNVVHAGDVESLTDKLTQLFEAYLFSSQPRKAEVMEAVDASEFSFWYGAGAFPNYLRATSELFGHDPGSYFEALARLLGSAFFREWIAAEDDMTNRTIGRLARLTARLGPRPLQWLCGPWWRFVELMVARRSWQLLKGRVPVHPSVPEKILPLQHLVLGHGHKASSASYHVDGLRKGVYMTASPRWHVTQLQRGIVHLYRDSGVVVVGPGDGVRYESAHEASEITRRRRVR